MHLFVNLPSCTSTAPTLDGISVKFDVVDFHENLSRIFECCSSRTKISGALHEDLNVCIIVRDICSASVYKTNCFSCTAMRYMLIALLTTYVHERYKEKATFFAFPSQQWLGEHVTMLLYAFCLPCLSCQHNRVYFITGSYVKILMLAMENRIN